MSVRVSPQEQPASQVDSALRRFARLSLSDERIAFAELAGSGSRANWASAAFVAAQARLLSGPPWLSPAETGEVLSGAELAAARLLAPVTPSKIVCIGRNYRAHASELGHEVPAEPMLFFKPSSSVIGPGDTIELPERSVSTRVEHEAELAIVIGRRARRVPREDARAHMFGFTCAGDITARDLQKKDGQWARAKGMDTFCPVGPVIASGLDPSRLAISARVSGENRQAGTTADMVHDCDSLVAYVSRFFTLEPGDLVLTGTPSGVGPLLAGDELVIEVEGLGALWVRVADARA